MPSEQDQLNWVDATGRAWAVSLTPESMTFQSGDERVDVPSESWSKDLHITAHRDGCILRVSTFDADFGFVLTGEQAAPLHALFGPTQEVVSDANEDEDEAPASDRRALMWPKVSRLGVWAVIVSALAFLPFLGFVAAGGTLALVFRHRRRVRPSRAWDHSRTLCKVAIVFVLLGLPVCWVATRSTITRVMPNDNGVGDYALDQGTTDAYEYEYENEYENEDENVEDIGDEDSSINWGLVVAAVLVVLGSLTVHEAAHAITAWWLGDDFAHRLGRVTLNPMAHIDPFGTIVLPVILLMMKGMVFGWARPVPVRMDHVPNPRRAHILVSLAGPGSNLLMAAASLLLLLALAYVVGFLVPDASIHNITNLDLTLTSSTSGFVLAPIVNAFATLLKLGFLVNVFLAFFNLIPIPPLDGSWVLEHLFPRTFGPIYARVRPFGFMLFLILIYSGAIPYLLWPAIKVMQVAILVLYLSAPL